MADRAEKTEKKPVSQVTCPDCGGRKVVSFGTTDVRCAACRGRGTVKG